MARGKGFTAMSGYGETVHAMRGRLLHSTNDAYKFLPEGWEEGEAVWIPASQTREVHREFATTGFDRMVVTAWIAKQKGIG